MSHHPLYVAARRVLLDALEALARHRQAVILAGAQAIYVRTGSADLDASVAPYTTDADLTIDPRRLGPEPQLDGAMRDAGFVRSVEPGIWLATTMVDGTQADIPVDLLVPEALAGRGRRSAELPGHGRNAARRTPGLEVAVVDHSDVVIASLEPDRDPRKAPTLVAGTAALFVAKAHKLAERLRDADAGKSQRVKPKDASDVVRLMRADTPDVVGARLRKLSEDEIAGESVRKGVDHIRTLFSRRQAAGVELAVRALAGAMPEDSVQALTVAYVRELLASYESA
jgi:hypothetical protein